MLAIRDTTRTTSNTAPFKVRDPLLLDDTTRGVQYLFDLAFGWCYSAGSPVPSNSLVRDMAEWSDGRVLTAGGAPTQTGGGFAFTGVTGPGTMVQGPTSATQAIALNGQHFLMCGYFFMPSLANWSSSNADGTAPDIMSFAASANYLSAPDVASLFVRLANSVPQLRFARQTSIGASANVNMSPVSASIHGRVSQIAMWRNNAGIGLSICNSSGRITATDTAGANNVANLTDLRPQWGVCRNWSTNNAAQLAMVTQFRVYRGWVEALAISGRNPIATLDADYGRNIARFS